MTSLQNVSHFFLLSSFPSMCMSIQYWIDAKNSALMEMQDYAVLKLVSNALLPAQNVILMVSEN